MSDSQPIEKNCVEPDAEYIKLISSDKKEFLVKRSHAEAHSDRIKELLSGPRFSFSGETIQIEFTEIPSRVLGEVCKYIEYCAHCKATGQRADAIFNLRLPRGLASPIVNAAIFLGLHERNF